ncbi:nicotinamide riboside transporter PnuC [Carboxylicivirga mesophila]|uniref:Nicotinamide riboside transporter PnuC n=1 Tax=Carboxylicivirga mesophila TaxID=1166478 RepID=A0ABS5K9G8_9BACT|nr:nicotinamide riboside transporter PnuC [Carboxylicivirga mesophila]MBS2211038.1 nicotinamide riboside transporter PnuC [Carboxylicivirga mesophila]
MNEFIAQYGLEVTGTVASIIYLIYSILENPRLWPWGIIASGVSIVVFYQSALYADMGLQFYYVAISIYGWWYWLSGQATTDSGDVPIKPVSTRLLIKLFLLGVIIYFGLLAALLNIPALVDIASSDLPYLDSFTTAASILATWLLARKYIHHWVFWVVINSVSMGMYIYKGLYFYSFLFLVYTIGAIIGFYEWKRLMAKHEA